ncbi:MAG: hypothetical protein IPK07_25890 [Deltaproteobacteria bacterium]|nr:hypothetical protein [Deltaproteobacteria bacterium]
MNRSKPARRLLPIAALLGSFTGTACVSDQRPEAPAILRDTFMIDDDVRFTHPYVPGHRTTIDGRVAAQVQGSGVLNVYLFAPEKLASPILTGPPGPELLADPTPVQLTFPPEMAGMTNGHTALCDAPGLGPDGTSNPYPCGPDSAHDCYDFKLVNTTSESIAGAQFWGTPMHVEVANPKTAEAHIVEARFGTPVKGSFLPLTNDFPELSVTSDGRLLTGRAGGAPRAWTNPVTGETLVRQYELGYYLLPEDAEPCDVTRWTTYTPMSHAPFDPRMKGRYGLAAYPFRDTEGNPIEDGEDMGGTYPWVDRAGKNVFIAAVPGRIAEQSQVVFPRRCVTEGCEQYGEQTDWDRGFMVAGLWTHGKLVHLDALINNLDWAAPVDPLGHHWVSLYRDAEGADVEVRIGGGRGGPGPTSRRPPGFSGNENILDSMEHLHNHQAKARTVTPRDVVWVMGTGLGTDEIVFDDYLDPNAFIVSNMQGSITQLRDPNGATYSIPKYWNGQVRVLLAPIRLLEELYVLVPDAVEEVHLQNAATSLAWNVPTYGLVAAGTGRVEPTAIGGIKGKGFWLDGLDTVTYDVPAQTRVIDETDWFVAIHLDSRAPDDAPRTVARFPDGTEIALAGRTVQYLVGDETVHEVELPTGEPGSGWFHLALRLTLGNRRVTLLHDGYPLDRFEADTPLFTMAPGAFTLGRLGAERAGFEGWVDELKVLAHAVNPEVACNHAFGTLVRVDDHDGWRDVAGRYPAWAHAEVAAAAGDGAGGTSSACFHDYSADYAAHLRNRPAGTSGLREAINFPEGPLRAGVPRPDSTSNAFCRDCHHASGQGGLSIGALARDPNTPAELDTRRQPLQPPPRVFGNIPAHWVAPGAGPGSPAEAFRAPPEGVLVDPWLLEGPRS